MFGKKTRISARLAWLISSLVCLCFSCAVTPESPRSYDRRALLTQVSGSSPVTVGDYIYYKTAEATEGESPEPAHFAVGLTETARSKTSLSSFTVSVPEDGIVTGIWHGGFRSSKATSITIPDSVTVVDYEAFMDSHLTSIELSCYVREIGEAAFYSCKELTMARIKNSNNDGSVSSEALTCNVSEAPGELDDRWDVSQLHVIPALCFFNCTALRTFYLPQSITEISYEAFRGCVSLISSLTFASLETIRSRAFQDCISVSTASLPASVFDSGTIEDKAFEGCYDTIKFYFSHADDATFSTWLSNHSDWGTAGSGKPHTYERVSAETKYTDDWRFTGTEDGATIEAYTGSTTYNGQSRDFLTIPSVIGGYNVTRLSKTFLDHNDYKNFKKNLRRIYLPTTLEIIETGMFGSAYTNLVVVDAADKSVCTSDSEKEADPHDDLTPRIDLHKLTSLEVIGNEAFHNMNKINDITKLHLPSHLVCVGQNAFTGSQNSNHHMTSLTSFQWDYDPDNPTLEEVAHEAFYSLGNRHHNTSSGFNAGTLSPTSRVKVGYELSTIVFPKTLKSFYLSSSMIARYPDVLTYMSNGSSKANVGEGAHVFSGCPMLEKVVFKGGEGSNDLVLSDEAICFNESLRTIVFEERPGKSITFHTNRGKWIEPCIGGNAGRSMNDFQGDPYLQTLVLPNVETTLYIQDYAFMANSRSAIYLSGTLSDTTHIKGDTSSASGNSRSVTDISNIPYWRHIGDENFHSTQGASDKGYAGYCFAENFDKNEGNILQRKCVVKVNNADSSYTNSFEINQLTPVYDQVYYHDEFTLNGKNVTVSVGDPESTRKVVEKDDFVFVTDSETNQATVARYLYDRYGDGSQGSAGAAIIPASVNGYPVKTIGKSAFSASYSDATDRALYANRDFTKLYVPNTLKAIGDYAFMRCYGLTEISTYTGSYTYPAYPSVTQYEMPDSLEFVGKLAFAFTSIREFHNFPASCVFYENSNVAQTSRFLDADACEVATYQTPSVFSNDLDLRFLSFETGSIYYTNNYKDTSVGAADSNEYTSSLYCTSGAAFNPDRLLLVLNRDPAHYATRGHVVGNEDGIDGTDDLDDAGFFRGGKKTNPFLYGAFKMGVWISKLELGTPTTQNGASGGTRYDQALFTPVATVTRSDDADPSTLTTSRYEIYLFMYTKPYSHADNKCNLVETSGDILGVSPYSFKSCEILDRIGLPYRDGAVLPKGILAGVENNIKFVTPGNPDGTGEPVVNDPGVLNLENTGYKSIGKEAFMGSSAVTKIIAPDRSGFTVDEKAFQNCTSLVEVDFSHVKGDLLLNSNCFNGCTNLTWDNITWPDPSSINKITFGKSCFQGCTGLTEVLFPGKSVFKDGAQFYGCTNLARVSRVSIATDPNVISATALPDSIFYNCGKLDDFDFTAFPNLQKLSNNAFRYAGKLATDGNIVLPDTVNEIGEVTFQGIQATTFTVGNTANIFWHRWALQDCPNLTHIYHKNPDSTWLNDKGQYQNSTEHLFARNPVLEACFLPSGFNVAGHTQTNTFYNSNSALCIYVNSGYVSLTKNWNSLGNTSALVVYRADSVSDVDTSKSTTDYWWNNGDSDCTTYTHLGKPMTAYSTAENILFHNTLTNAYWRMTTTDGATTVTSEDAPSSLGNFFTPAFPNLGLIQPTFPGLGYRF